jgi:carbon-monoxide dehydrogenase large subunit
VRPHQGCPPAIRRTASRPRPPGPLGAKGIGESGALGVPAAVANAVIDALAPHVGVAHADPP